MNPKDLKEGNYYIYRDWFMKEIYMYIGNAESNDEIILDYNYKFKVIAYKNICNGWSFKDFIEYSHKNKKLVEKLKPFSKYDVMLLKI